MGLISLIYSASGDDFYLDDENIIRVYSLSSETRVEYADVEAGISRTVVVDESVSTVGGSSNILIALTETASGATFYLNSNKISSVLTEGTGSLIYFDVLGKKSQVVVDEAKSAIDALIPNNTSAPYKSYTATISQSNTDAPVLTELNNTAGITITPSYSGTLGVFILTSAGSFPAGKTIINSYRGYTALTNEYIMETYVTDTDTINITSRTNGNLANSILTSDQFWIEIRIYP